LVEALVLETKGFWFESKLGHHFIMKKHNNRNQAARARNSKIVQDHKKDKACQDCGGAYPSYVLDLDHIDPKTKVGNVSKLAGQPISAKRILAEIAKTEIVCSNCHRKRTYQRRKTK
jgi:hypothetical protein